MPSNCYAVAGRASAEELAHRKHPTNASAQQENEIEHSEPGKHRVEHLANLRGYQTASAT